MKDRYTLFEFPGGRIVGKFNFKFTAWLCAKWIPGVCELQDNKTGKYHAYWA